MLSSQKNPKKRPREEQDDKIELEDKKLDIVASLAEFKISPDHEIKKQLDRIQAEYPELVELGFKLNKELIDAVIEDAVLKDAPAPGEISVSYFKEMIKEFESSQTAFTVCKSEDKLTFQKTYLNYNVLRAQARAYLMLELPKVCLESLEEIPSNIFLLTKLSKPLGYLASFNRFSYTENFFNLLFEIYPENAFAIVRIGSQFAADEDLPANECFIKFLSRLIELEKKDKNAIKNALSIMLALRNLKKNWGDIYSLNREHNSYEILRLNYVYDYMDDNPAYEETIFKSILGYLPYAPLIVKKLEQLAAKPVQANPFEIDKDLFEVFAEDAIATALAMYSGLHPRCGRNSIFAILTRSSIFDRQAMSIATGLAGITARTVRK